MISKDKISLIYTAHSKELFRYLLRLTGNHHAAEDLLHEVFEKFIVYTENKIVQDDKIRAFLYKTAHNCGVNHLSRQNRTGGENIDDIEDSLRTNDTHYDDIIIDEFNRRVYEIVETLPPESRSIFILHKENNKTYGEIAEELGISERTVRRKVKQMLDILYKILKNEGYD